MKGKENLGRVRGAAGHAQHGPGPADRKHNLLSPSKLENNKTKHGDVGQDQKPSLALPAFPRKRLQEKLAPTEGPGPAASRAIGSRPGQDHAAHSRVPTAPSAAVGQAVAVRRASGIERLKALSLKGGPRAATAPSPAYEDASTVGFNSPEKGKAIEEITREEVKRLVRDHRRQPSSGGGALAEEGSARDLVDRDQEHTRTSLAGLSLASSGQHHRSSSAAGAGSAAAAAIHEDARMELVTRDVAARIIQYHWRNWLQWKAELRKKAEEDVLRQLLGSNSDLKASVLGATQPASMPGPSAPEHAEHAHDFPANGITHHRRVSEAGSFTGGPDDDDLAEDQPRSVPAAASRRTTGGSSAARGSAAAHGAHGKAPSSRNTSAGGSSKQATVSAAAAKGRAPRAFHGAAADEKAAGAPGITRRRSMPGGHFVYTVSATPSETGAAPCDENGRLQAAELGYAGAYGLEAEASALLGKHQPTQEAAEREGARRSCAAVAGAGPDADSDLAHEHEYQDADADDEVQHPEDAADGAAADGDAAEGPWEQEAGPDRAGHVQQLLRMLAAGHVPESIHPDDLQLLMVALEKSRGKVGPGQGADADDQQDAEEVEEDGPGAGHGDATGRRQAWLGPGGDLEEGQGESEGPEQEQDEDVGYRQHQGLPGKPSPFANPAIQQQPLSLSRNASEVGEADGDACSASDAPAVPGPAVQPAALHSHEDETAASAKHAQQPPQQRPSHGGSSAGASLGRQSTMDRLRKLSAARGSSAAESTSPAPAQASGSVTAPPAARAQTRESQPPATAGTAWAAAPAAQEMEQRSRPGTGLSTMRASTVSGAHRAPSGSFMEDEDLDTVHELRASQMLPDGQVHLVGRVQQQPHSTGHAAAAAHGHDYSGRQGAAGSTGRAGVGAAVSQRYSSAPGASPEKPAGQAQVQDRRRTAPAEASVKATRAGAARDEIEPELYPEPAASPAPARRAQHDPAPANAAATGAARASQRVTSAATSTKTPAARAGPLPQQQEDTPAASMTAEKLSSILNFLDEVEQRSAVHDVVPTPHAAAAATQLQVHATMRASTASLAPSSMGASLRPANAGAQPKAAGAGAAVAASPASGHPQSEYAASPYSTYSAATEELIQQYSQYQQAAAGTAMAAGLRASTTSCYSAAPVGFAPSTGPPRSAARRISAGDALLQRIGLLEDEPGQGTAAGHGNTGPSAGAHAKGPADGPSTSHGSVGSLAAGLAELPVGATSSCATPSAAGGQEGAGTGAKPAVLAETVYDGVRSKIRRLQEEVRERDSTINLLHKELEALQARARNAIADAEGRTSDLLAAARAEHEAALARHLSFMDRLLADKDELNRKCATMAEAMKTSEERHERALAKLKEGWGAELRRQKDAWAASEKAKREAWQEAKTTEVKELTVKGLETEVQKLLAKHKAEVAAVQAAMAEEARRALDVAAAQHELAMRQLKDRLLKEQEEALEKERAAAAARAREAAERYEQAASMQRMRLVADHDMRLEQLEASRREERKRHEEAIAKAAAEAEERLRAAEDEARRERDAMRRAHEKQMDEVRSGADAEAEGWRAAVAERARRDLAEREAALRDRMARERDQQIEAIVSRLEAENAAAREAAREEAAKREAAAAARHAAELREAKKREARLLEQFRAAGGAQQASEARVAAAEAAAEAAKREAEARASTIRWLESQLAEERERLSVAERAARGAAGARDAAAAAAVQAVMREKEGVEARLAAAHREIQELRTQHAAEMGHVEARVKAALARKEEALGAAQAQVAALSAQLRSTEAVLAAQQAELRGL